MHERRATGGQRWDPKTRRPYSASGCSDRSKCASAASRSHASATAQFLLALAETAEPELTRPDQARLEREHDNLGAALAWSCSEDAESGDVELGLRMAGRLVEFWSWGGYHREGRDQLLRLLARSGAALPTVGRA